MVRADPDKYVGREPAAAGIEEQSMGWKNTFGSGNAGNTITSGLEENMDYNANEVEQ